MELKEFDKLAEFKPFYDESSTQRLLSAYIQKPHLFKEESVAQIKDHASFYGIEFEEPPTNTPKDNNFNLLRGIKGMGEGFLSGFSTFQVGEPGNNEYERIMRSVGELAGFVGYLPAAPLKAMKAYQLANAAQALKGNSVPLMIAKKATEKVRPIVGNVLKKSAEAKNDAFRTASNFMLNEKAKHVVEGTFNLGIASGVGSWQYGVDAMISGALHGGLTGGAFRGIANLINRGGIPKLDKATNKYVYTSTQREDQVLRAAASSLYEGLQSSYRGETTPEQIYSYLLGAYFGAHETTAGQMQAMRFVEKTEKQAQTRAKDLKRLNEDGKPFQWDTVVYDPRLVSGWDKLPSDVKDSVMHTMLMRHGTYGAQDEMHQQLLTKTHKELGDDFDVNTLVLPNPQEVAISNRAEKLKTKFDVVEEIDVDMINNRPNTIFLTEKFKKERTLTEVPKDEKDLKYRVDNVVNLPIDKIIKDVQDEIYQDGDNRPKAMIRDALSEIPEGKDIVVEEGYVQKLRDVAPETADYLADKMLGLESGRDKAIASLNKSKMIDEYHSDGNLDIGNIPPEAELVKASRQFVNKHLRNIGDGLEGADKAKSVLDARDKVYNILEKHAAKYNGKTINDEAFVKDLEKELLDGKTFKDEAKLDLRNLLIRRNMQRDVPLFNLHIDFKGNAKIYSSEFLGNNKPKNRAGDDKLQGDSTKAIETEYEQIILRETGQMPKDRAYMIWDTITTQYTNDRYAKSWDLKKLGEKKTLNDSTQKFADNNKKIVITEGLKALEKKGYYYNGGKGDGGKMYFSKLHPKLEKMSDANILALKNRIVNSLDKKFASHYETFTRRWRLNTNKTKDFNNELYHHKAFVNNVFWERSLSKMSDVPLEKYMVVMGRKLLDEDNKWGNIKDGKDFNKRNQIWYTDGFSVDVPAFKAEYKKSGNKLGSLSRGQVKFGIFNEASGKTKDGKKLSLRDRANLYEESTDGSILVEANFIKTLNKIFGLPSSGQNKSFIVHADKDNGPLLGKFMFHEATPEASAWMRKNGYQMMMPKSAVKERGFRTAGDLIIPDKLADHSTKTKFTGEDYYLDLENIRGSLSEKQTTHMLEAQGVPKQLMSNLVHHASNPIAREVMRDFFDELVGKRFIGDPIWNKRMDGALEKSDKLTDMEMKEFLDNIEKVSLTKVIDAVKSPTQPEFASRLYQRILNKNMEDVIADYESGYIEKSEYDAAIGEARVLTSGINRMMEIWPDRAVFLHKSIRDYMQAAMRSFVVNRVSRPKWEHSISARMRGIDPWMQRNENFKDINLEDSAANKKYLKKTYGAENADELFYLDNAFKKVKWDVSSILEGKSAEKKMTLEELWDKYGQEKQVQDFFTTIGMRVPMDSISGARQLRFAGWSGLEGHGVVLHPRTMEALGGADLDGDKAFMFFGFKPEWREMYHSNKLEFTGDDGVTSNNKKGNVPSAGVNIIKESLNPKDKHDRSVLEKINQGKLTFQDLLTVSNDGSSYDRALIKGMASQYAPYSRFLQGENAAKGRDQLGPAVINKQTLNAMYDALVNNKIQRYRDPKSSRVVDEKYYDPVKHKGWKPDTREEIIVRLKGDKKAYKIYIEPRTTKAELDYSRALMRAQIGFGSDPLDEIGLSGREHYFNTAWHSLFKIDWNRNRKIRDKFSPNIHARGGTFGLFKDFNSAYFGRNWEMNRRFYADEIMAMSKGIHRLQDSQTDTMLPQMVKVLEQVDYTDNMLNKINVEDLKSAYADHERVSLNLQKLNDVPGVDGGLLGRKTFSSKPHPYMYRVMEADLTSADNRIAAFENPAIYKNIFRDMTKAELGKTKFKDRFGDKDFWKKSFPVEFADQFKTEAEFQEAFADSYNFRKNMINKVYRQATDFIQNDAMDRVSAQRLEIALKQALDEGTPRAQIIQMSKFVEEIKQYERAEKAKAFHDTIKEDFDNLSENDSKAVTDIFKLDRSAKEASSQQIIDQRIKLFKTQNAYRRKMKAEVLDENGNPTYPLTRNQSYLLDTMFLSTYYRGDKLFKKAEYDSIENKKLKKVLLPMLRELESGNAGTYFTKVGLNSPFIDTNAIRDWLQDYSKQYDLKTADFDIDVNKALKEPDLEKIKVEDADPVIWEHDYQGIRHLREKAVAKLDDVERALVDELAGHLNYYHQSISDAQSLNKITRALVQKDLNALSIADYRTLNNYFNDLRNGTMFIKPGKLTKNNIVKLAERHWMLFPRTVNKELMTKDFELFEQEGFFQNYKGEWRRGMVARPTQVVEQIQYVLGKAQDGGQKLSEDEKALFNKELQGTTGYHTIKDGIGHALFEVATARRDLLAIKNGKSHIVNFDEALDYARKNLKEAEEKAGWEANKNKTFEVTGDFGTESRSPEAIVKSIDTFLTKQAIQKMRWIRGSHWNWSESAQDYVQVGKDPINDFILKDSRGRKLYYGTGKDKIPEIDGDKFAKHILKQMQEGKHLDISIGLDNLRLISRSIAIKQITTTRDRAIKMGAEQSEIDHYNQLINNLQRMKIDKTNHFKPQHYHPHMIENKAVAKKAIGEAIERLQKRQGEDPEKIAREVKRLVMQYRKMTGEWMIEDFTDTMMIDGALQEIAAGKKGEHMKNLDANPTAHNMMSRTQNLPGWARDAGVWEVYQQNLIDTYYRQIGQIVSKHMLNNFMDHTGKTWNDPAQSRAWNNFIADYITRSMGFPTKIPEHWTQGPEANLMKVKGTPYSWFADNHVKDRLNKIRKKLGFKEDMRLPEELRGLDEMDLRHWSNLEAKYQMATLLAHPKSAVANIFGGNLHTIQSVGWRTWRNSRNIEYLHNTIGGEARKWTTKKDIEDWAISHGVVPDFILHETGLQAIYKGGKWKDFLDDAKRLFEKDARVADETLISLAKKHKITESAFNKAAWFMREPERALRRDSFVAHYLQAREKFGHSNMPLDHPMLIEMAKKGVKATQFLYSAPFRPAFSATSLGKVMTRFQTWAWNSVRFRNDVYRDAKIYGFQRGTQEFERFKRQYTTDMFVLALGNVFAYSIFENAMPAPYNWFQDTADWIFGDERERERAFFGQWPTAVAPLQMVTPPGLRLVPATFSAIANDDWSRVSDYYMWTMFPFGRVARDIKGTVENPMRAVEKFTGIPYQQFAREATKYREKEEEEL